MTAKTKTLTLLMTSVVTLGAVTALLFGNNNNIFSLRGEGEYSSRTATANQNNRMTKLCYVESSSQESFFLGAAFPLSQKDSYTMVRTSHNQRDVEKNNNDCVFALWGGTLTYFTVNPSIITNDRVFYRYDTSTGTRTERLGVLSKFDHLKSFDIVLDTKSSDHVATGFTCDEDYGTISDPVVGEGTTTFTWTANTESGYVDRKAEITITGNSIASNQAYWVKQLVFYYDC